MPVIATVNLKEREIFNTTTFTIHVITPNSVKLSNVVDEIPLKDFTENFVLNFCSTIYKWHWQGSTITEPYAILDTNHMVRSRTLYTALSRAKIPDHIRLDPTTVNKQAAVLPKKAAWTRAVKCLGKQPTVYQNGKLYLIEFSDGYLYIGSTCKNINEKLTEHLKDKKSSVYKHNKTTGTTATINL